MNDDSIIKIMQSLGLDYNPAINSTKAFEKRIDSLNKQLAMLKNNAMQGARDVNNIFSSQLGNANSRAILDQWGIPIRTIREEAQAAAQPISEMNNALNNTGNAVENTGNRFTSNAAKFYAFVRAGKEATKTITDVEMGMISIQRVMEDSSFVFDEYRDNLFKLGIDYGQTFDNAQNIALRWAQSGYNVADSLKLTETSLLALNAAELDAKNATESMIGIMSQWNLEAQDLELVMDKINKTADTHAATSQDLVDGLLRSSGAARTMNLSIEETIALLVNMREASGRTGKEVGNALNSIISYMQRPSAIKAFENVGINMFADSAKTQFRNVMDIFDDMSKGFGTIGDELSKGFLESADSVEFFNEELATSLGLQEEWNDLQKRDVSQSAAGVHRRNFLIGLMERFGNTQKALNGMIDAEGYSMRKNADTMESLEKKHQSLKTSMESLAVAMGDAGLTGTLKGLAVGGTDALNMMTSLPKGAKDAVLGFTNVFLTVKALDAGMKLFGMNLPVISAGLTIFTGGISNATTNIMAFGTALKTTFVANAPLMGMAALAGGLIALWNHMKKVREEAEKYIQTTTQNIKNLAEEKQGLTELAKEYETLKDKEKNLTATADEKTRLLEIQRELVDTYGVSITGINAEGQAYADSTNAIQDRIKALEELKAIEEANLEDAVKGRDSQDVSDLEKNLNKRLQLEKDILEVQKKIDEYTNTLLNKGTISSPSGSGTIDASTEHGAKILRDYIANTSREKVALQTSLNDVNTAISEGTQDRQQLLMADATKLAQQLTENGVVVSDSARVYATELAKALSQAPRDIFTLRDELETAIKEFTSSDFEEWSDKYQKAIANSDTKGIDEASHAIMGLVRGFVEGKPELDNFALAMEGTFANSKALQDTTKATFDLKTALGNMGNTAKKSFDDLKTLNQAIYDVERGQSLSIDTILELIEKYNLSTDAVKQTAKGYTVEVSALENLRQAKIQTATDGIESEKVQAEAVRDQVLSRIKNYGLEIEQLKNLATVRAALAQQAHREGLKSMAYSDSQNAYDDGYNTYIDSAMNDVELAQGVLIKIEEIEKRSNLLSGMLNDKSYGVSESKTKDKKYENKALDEALKLLEHRKRISEETKATIKSEIAELNRINSLYVKNADERMNMTERIYSAEKRLRDRTLQDSINWINEKKSLNELSVEEEIAAWERIKKNQGNNLEARRQAELNLYKLKNQVTADSFSREENSIKHLAKLGILSLEEQIEKLRELNTYTASSIEEERRRTENLFGLYKDLIKDQQKTVKDAYDKRIEQIDEETKKKKSAQEDIIKGIERELELLDRQEDESDHEKKMSKLREDLAYWQVRTSEDARKKVAELLKQIDEAEHKREVELKKQGLEDTKKIAQDEIKTIEETAKEEREKWEKSYKLVEKAFDDHSTNIVALAGTMSKEAYQQWIDNYLTPLQNALSSGNLTDFESAIPNLQGSIQDLQTHDWGMSNVDYQRFIANGERWKQLQSQGFKESMSSEMQKLRAENDALRVKYGRDPKLGEYPEFHTGAKTLSYGVAMFKPGELVFPPDLSVGLERLFPLLSNLAKSNISTESSSFTDNKREINIENLVKIDKNYMEDEVDERSFARELQRAIASMA